MGAGDSDDGPVCPVGRHPERVVFALDHEHRHINGVEFVEARLLRATRWVNRERETENGGRIGLGSRSARNPTRPTTDRRSGSRGG
jgi:hypothetical protein